jgi:hypothetical protein
LFCFEKSRRSGACRREIFPNQESTTYRDSTFCKLLILRSRKSISDRLSGCPRFSPRFSRYAITGETNGPSGLLDFSGLTKITNPFRSGNSFFGNIRASFAKGPDLLGGGAAIAGGAGYGQSGCQR